MAEIILASSSPFRARLLKNAGISFRSEAADLDERAVEAPLAESGASPDDVALVLAEAKAASVSERHPDAIVIGCDQTLSLGDRIFHKPADMEAARHQLLQLSGQTHNLNSAVVLASNGEAVWRHVNSPALTMRTLEPAFIGRYLAEVGEDALASVGAYQLEGRGIQLFSAVEGDYFSIVGLPLLPLLQRLRAMDAIDG